MKVELSKKVRGMTIGMRREKRCKRCDVEPMRGVVHHLYWCPLRKSNKETIGDES